MRSSLVRSTCTVRLENIYVPRTVIFAAARESFGKPEGHELEHSSTRLWNACGLVVHGL